MKKQALTALLVLLLLCSLAACKDRVTDVPGTSADATVETTSSQSGEDTTDAVATDATGTEETEATVGDETEPEETGETKPSEPDEPRGTTPVVAPDETEPDETEPEETEPEQTQPEETEPEQTQPGNPGAPGALAGAVPESAPVDGSYFDDAVFIGDSVSLKLAYYEAAVNKLGGAQFLTAGSLGSGNALWAVSSKSVHPTYQGVKMRLEDSVPLTGAKKLYIMLGMNDIAVYGINGAVNNMVTLIEGILANVPDMEVFIQSMTPIGVNSNVASKNGLNNTNIRRYNEALLAMAQAKGWHFVDVASVMYDSNGYLREDYCSDNYDMALHFSNAGCEAWIAYLKTHTA